MNRKQLIVLWIELAVIVGMVVFPPWIPTSEGYRSVGERVHYSPIWRDPEKIGGVVKNYDRYREVAYGSVNYRRLVLQVAVVGGVVGCLIVTFRRKQ
ncbi:MAG TPA: hypothetical protein VM223_08510 [Planctomycetota bacterium]|nr:hypothetical protein [Planctomycetota bacterium]